MGLLGHRIGIARTAALVGVLVIGALALAPAPPAGAAGVTTHSWMDADAIDKVTSTKLKALLKANATMVRAGAHFPDSGYALSNTYGEEAHWQRFHDAYAAQILTHTECTDLTLPNGPCAGRIAFLMGMIGHGMGDEVWDWLFEPYSADLNEYYVPSDLGSYANKGGAELQMDLAAVADYGQPSTPIAAFPDHSDLLDAFAAVGRSDVDDSELNLGYAAMNVVHQAEGTWAPTHIDALHAAMPWMSHNMVTAPGGVLFAGTAIAGAWDAMWGRLLGNQPTTKVSITYPGDGERRVPPTGWVRSHEPGSSPGRGGARTRIAAALTYARPYDGSAGTVTSELPAGSMTLEERDTGDPVALASGWPRSVPYGPDAGEHVVGLEPAADLKPCTWYRASVTANLVDARNQPVAPKTWEFRTGASADPDASRCPDDPFTPDERYARTANADVLDRTITDDELHDLTYSLARGRTRADWVKDLLGSAEERGKLVDDAFQHYLGRAADSGGRAYWVTKLKTIKLPEFEAQLAGAPEVYRKAGSTNAGYVTALYQLINGRAVDPGGLAYWTGRLDAGLSRGSFAKLLLTSHETAGRTVKAAFQHLLSRAPDSGGAAYWTTYLERGNDQRDLWRSVMGTGEYDRKAQNAS